MARITRGDFGFILGAQTQTRTVKSDYLTGTIFEDREITDDWLVTHVSVDENGILCIECVPQEYENA